ncbi:MAG: hypothetical protein U0T73_02610 [Chitinophagales bacterium]
MHNTGDKASGVSLQAILGALLDYAVIGKLGLFLLPLCWPDYELHSIDKSFTLTMLLMRLIVALAAAAAAGFTVAKWNGNLKSALIVALVCASGAAYVHFFTITFTQYPMWYHCTYVFSVLPLIILSAYCFNKMTSNHHILTSSN